jgi:hypothetical protein
VVCMRERASGQCARACLRAALQRGEAAYGAWAASRL